MEYKELNPNERINSDIWPLGEHYPYKNKFFTISSSALGRIRPTSAVRQFPVNGWSTLKSGQVPKLDAEMVKIFILNSVNLTGLISENYWHNIQEPSYAYVLGC